MYQGNKQQSEMKLSTLIELVDMYEDTHVSTRNTKKVILNHLMDSGIMDVDVLFYNTGRLISKVSDDLRLHFDDVYAAFEEMFQYAEVVEQYPMETRIYSYDVRYTSSDASSDSDETNKTVIDPSKFKYQMKNGMRNMYQKMTSLEGMTCLNLGITITTMILTFIGVAFTAKMVA